MFGSEVTGLIISNEEMNDIMKIVKSLKKYGLLIKTLAKQLKMKQENKKEHFQECQLVKEKLELPPHSLTNFEIKSIIRTNINWIVFIQEIIYQK